MIYSIRSKIIYGVGVGLCIIGLLFTYSYIKRLKHKKHLEVARQIYNVLDQYRIPYDIDKRSIDVTTDTTPQPAQGVEQCVNNISYFVAQKNRPITMLLVGFPFKSGNREKKVIGYLPDMAERKSLEYLQKILNEIKAVYPPGATILIFCDGVMFAEFFGIPIADVIAYEKALKLLAADLPDITVFTSEDMLKTHKLKEISEINTLIDHYEPSDEQFKADLKSIPETALKRFALELDHAQGRLLLNTYTLEDIVIRLLAREMRLRTYVTKAFPSPEFFRLTVHLSTDVSKKFGIRVSPTSDLTPYHGVLVQEENGAWAIQYKKDIDMERYCLQGEMINGVMCGYFKRR